MSAMDDTKWDDDQFFIKGARVHYADVNTWLALCGTGWLNASTHPEQVTCLDCLNLLEQREHNSQQAPTEAQP